jgi:EpsI family protein
MSRPRSWSRLAPWASAAVLVAVWAVHGIGSGPAPDTTAYFAQVAETIDTIPYKIGDWVGTDVEVQPAAIDLLKPNKLLQRRYRNTETGAVTQVLIVHCGDTRDMLGHFPPVCYPAHGWVQLAAQPDQVRITQTDTPATTYRFKRSLGEIETEMVVTNFFVLPGTVQLTAPDMNALNAAAQSLAASAQGSAQVQIVTDPALTDKQRAEIVDGFLQALEPAIRAMAKGRSSAQ